MPRRVLLAIDDSEHSRTAVDAALGAVVHRATDELHVVTVLPPPAAATYPMAPMASAAAVTAMQHTLAAQKHAQEAEANETLQLCAALLVQTHKVPRELIHLHVLPAAGGASGVADSIIEFCKSKSVDLVVLGSRGMGSIKRSLMSLVGLGSVSDAVCNAVPCAVMLAKGGAAVAAKGDEAQPLPVQGPKRVGIAYDDSPQAAKALQWALDHVLQPHDTLHIITVALPVPFTLVGDESAAVAAMEARQFQEESESSTAYAQQLADKARDVAAAHGVTHTKIVRHVLPPQDGTSSAGASICLLAANAGLSVVVAGSRGLGSLKASLLGVMGLGSVSQYLAHHLEACPLVVVKDGVTRTGNAEAIEFQPIVEAPEPATSP